MTLRSLTAVAALVLAACSSDSGRSAFDAKYQIIGHGGDKVRIERSKIEACNQNDAAQCLEVAEEIFNDGSKFDSLPFARRACFEATKTAPVKKFADYCQISWKYDFWRYRDDVSPDERSRLYALATRYFEYLRGNADFDTNLLLFYPSSRGRVHVDGQLHAWLNLYISNPINEYERNPSIRPELVGFLAQASCLIEGELDMCQLARENGVEPDPELITIAVERRKGSDQHRDEFERGAREAERREREYRRQEALTDAQEAAENRNADAAMIEALKRGLQGSVPAASAFPVQLPSGDACAAVEASCASEKRACESGGQVACYRAAACLCRANLAAGGCGSDPAGLRRCVAQNEENARRLQSSAPTFTSTPQVHPQPSPRPPQVAPTASTGCPPSARTCAAY